MLSQDLQNTLNKLETAFGSEWFWTSDAFRLNFIIDELIELKALGILEKRIEQFIGIEWRLNPVQGCEEPAPKRRFKRGLTQKQSDVLQTLISINNGQEVYASHVAHVLSDNGKPISERGVGVVLNSLYNRDLVQKYVTEDENGKNQIFQWTVNPLQGCELPSAKYSIGQQVISHYGYDEHVQMTVLHCRWDKVMGWMYMLQFTDKHGTHEAIRQEYDVRPLDAPQDEDGPQCRACHTPHKAEYLDQSTGFCKHCLADYHGELSRQQAAIEWGRELLFDGREKRI